jgi:hypothetical protein
MGVTNNLGSMHYTKKSFHQPPQMQSARVRIWHRSASRFRIHPTEDPTEDIQMKLRDTIMCRIRTV